MDSGELNVVPEWLDTVWPEAPKECHRLLVHTGGGSDTKALSHIQNLNSESQYALLTRLQKCSGDDFHQLREALFLLWSAQSSDDSDEEIMRSANSQQQNDAEEASEPRASNAGQITEQKGKDYELHFGPSSSGWKNMTNAQKATYNARTSMDSNVKYEEDVSIMMMQGSSATTPAHHPGRRAMQKPRTKSRNNKGKRPSVPPLSQRDHRQYDRGRRSSRRTAPGLSCCTFTLHVTRMH